MKNNCGLQTRERRCSVKGVRCYHESAERCEIYRTIILKQEPPKYQTSLIDIELERRKRE